MQELKVFVIRHGETQWNAELKIQGHMDSPLTGKGIKQAEILSDRLSGFFFDVIYSSDLGRSIQTAEIALKGKTDAIIYDKRLRERNFGIFHGYTRVQLQNKFPNEFEMSLSNNNDYIIPKGESNNQFSQRIMSFFEELSKTYKSANILVFTHGGVINYLVRNVLHIPFNVPRNFKLPNAAINIFSSNGNGWLVDCLGDLSYTGSIHAEDDITA